MAKVSVIVPVYNKEDYIERCLDSIKNQTKLNEVEIIIINDGSTDNSEKVIQEYIEKQENNNIIKYFSKKENQGIAKTRNFGIEKATCEYILFVDADDYIDSQLIEKLYKYMNEHIDLIKFKMQKVNKKGEVLEKIEGPIFEEMKGEEAFNKLYSKDVLIDSPCIYLIKKDLFDKYDFKFQQTYHEDFGLIPIILLLAESVVSKDEYLYYYVQVENSIIRNEDYQKKIKKMEDCLKHYDNMIKVIEKAEVGKKAKENIKIYYTNSILLKLNDLKSEEKNFFIKQIKKRKFYKNIKARNVKQFIKKIILRINIELYLKMR